MSLRTGPQSSGAIAIIGMSGRFPGAATLEAFWLNLRDGVESRSVFTDEDLAAEGVPLKFKHPRHVRSGFTLDGIDEFDSAFFGVNPREAETLDPQHRLFLECAWEALEHAGHDAERFEGTIGVYGGSTWCNYLVNNLFRSARLLKSVGHRQLVFGSVPDYMVTRVAYRLNLKGPAYFVQTACSTSLVAIHLARQSLVAGQCDMVLAGGVSVKVPHRVGYMYEEGGMESPDGRVRAFDAEAKGTVFGSGVGIVVLRRLEDALADGDTIHAVITGTATNNDGSLKVGFTAPSVGGQAEVVSAALADAGVSPDDIDYVEAHGTGTELGDPIELAALTRAYGARTSRRGYCGVGSVKPNIGHLDAAAGISSLIKTVLALRHRQLPPSINFERLNPKIELDESPFFINTTLRDWAPTDGRPRRAGVSSFGFGGTNAHVIVEEAPARASSPAGRSHQLLVLSARTRAALDAATANLAHHLSRDRQTNLADVAFTLQTGRKLFAFRKAIVAATSDEAIEALHGEGSRWTSAGQAGARDRRIVFMFPGQGAQYVNMGRGLYESEPVFRAVVDECAQALDAHLGIDLRAILYPTPGGEADATERLKRTVITQAAIFTVELALARLWMDWGIIPAAMAGHSIGELVAACLSGVLSLPDALALVARRGTVMEQMPEGAMLAVPLPESRVASLLGEGLWLAAANSPSLSVLAGHEAAIAGLERRLAEQGIDGRRLHTSHAFHSGLMDAAVAPFVDAVSRVSFGTPSIPYVSNVTGGWATADLVCTPEYWGRHIRGTVRFAENVAALAEEPDTLFLEVGPGTALGTFVRQQLSPQGGHVVLSSLRHPQEASPDTGVLLNALGRMWAAGVAVDWPAFHSDHGRLRVPLPAYPFERTRHWVDADKPSLRGVRRGGAIMQQDDLSDWFYVSTWKRAPLPLEGITAAAPEHWVVFADRLGVGASLAARLESSGRPVSIVSPGEGYARDGARYQIDPTAAGDYSALVKALYGSSTRPTGIVHLWSLDADSIATARVRGFDCLLYLSQAIGAMGVSSRLRLEVVTAGVQDVVGDETLVPARALAFGPARVMPFEFPNIGTRSIDLHVDADGVEAASSHLMAEILAVSSETTVAYRRGRRWVQTYEPHRVPAPTTAVSRLRDGGTYLITGGLGGVGLVLADFLARTCRANLVLTGRKGLPPRETWNEYSDRHGGDDGVARKIAAVQALERAGAQVMIGDADVADAPRLSAIVEEARARFGSIDGVIHAAGVAGGGMMQLKTPDVASAVLRPKVEGTEVLGRIFEGRRLDFLMLCSSLTSVLGNVGQVDYCAANAYLDAFARSYTSRTGTFTVAVNWPAWQEVGMAVDTDMPEALKSTMRQQMLAAGLSNAEGAEAFQRILAGIEDTQVAVSPLDVQLMLESAHQEPEREADAAEQAPSGSPQHARPDLSSAFVEPRTEMERRIRTIWQEMLGITQIGVEDNFFELGGHSLLAVRVMTRLNEVLGTEIPVAKLYEGLTVSALAALAEPRTDDAQGKVDDEEARERRREKARRQKEHQQRRLAASRR